MDVWGYSLPEVNQKCSFFGPTLHRRDVSKDIYQASFGVGGLGVVETADWTNRGVNKLVSGGSNRGRSSPSRPPPSQSSGSQRCSWAKEAPLGSLVDTLKIKDKTVQEAYRGGRAFKGPPPDAPLGWI